jgi:hypothetical protein
MTCILSYMHALTLESYLALIYNASHFLKGDSKNSLCYVNSTAISNSFLEYACHQQRTPWLYLQVVHLFFLYESTKAPFRALIFLLNSNHSHCKSN